MDPVGLRVRPIARVHVTIPSHRMYSWIGLKKSTSPQNRQLIVRCYQLENQVGSIGHSRASDRARTRDNPLLISSLLLSSLELSDTTVYAP